MKYTDDYKAKLKIWARDPRVVPLPSAPPLPRFGAKKFSSYAEFNAWKRALRREMAAETTCPWTT